MKGVNNEFSTKRVAFVLAVLVGLTAPTILAFLHWNELGSPWFTYMSIIVPTIVTAYTGGKYVDKLPNKNTPPSEKKDPVSAGASAGGFSDAP